MMISSVLSGTSVQSRTKGFLHRSRASYRLHRLWKDFGFVVSSYKRIDYLHGWTHHWKEIKEQSVRRCDYWARRVRVRNSSVVDYENVFDPSCGYNIYGITTLGSMVVLPTFGLPIRVVEECINCYITTMIKRHNDLALLQNTSHHYAKRHDLSCLMGRARVEMVTK